MRRSTLAPLILLLTVGTAVAQEVDTKAIYASSEDACKRLAKGASAFENFDFTVLTFDQGIQGDEFHCDFMDVKSQPDGPFSLAEAVCEIPGMRYPDLISIAPYSEGSIEVVSLYDSTTQEATDENPNPGFSTYYKCSIDTLPTAEGSGD